MKRLLIPAALAGLLMLIAGCGSDSLAPNDPLPPLSEDSSAQQAGLVAYSVATMGEIALNFSPKSRLTKTAKTDPASGPGYLYLFDGEDMAGSVNLVFQDGGATGEYCTPEAADYVTATVLDEGIRLTTSFGGTTFVMAKVMANITRGTPDSATVLGDSHGTLQAGDYQVDFSIGAVTVYGTGYPTGGPITCDNGYHTVSVQFDGTALADLSLDGTVKWQFNLDTMELVQVD